MKRLKIALIVTGLLTLILGAYGIYKEISSPRIDKKTNSVKDNVNEFKREVEQMEKMREEEIGEEEFKTFQNKLIKKYSTPESAVDYLISISMLEDINLFPEAFIPERYNKDIFGRSDPRKELLIEDAMKRLTRNGTITNIKYLDSTWTTDRNSTRIKADFYYNDLKKPIRLNILVTKQEITVSHSLNNQDQEGFEGENRTTDFYYINTSIWEMIDTIEKGAKQ